MKPSAVLATVLASATTTSAANIDVSDLLDKLPECSIDCLVNGVTNSGCNITDIACQCSKLEVLVRTVAPCLVKAGCNLTQIAGAGSAVVRLCQEGGYDLSSGLPTSTQVHGTTGSTAAKQTDQPGAAVQLQQMGWLGIAALVVGTVML